MLNLPKIAVTGGLSSGKSSACRFFKDLGAYVVSADDIVHQLLSSATPLGQQVIKLLGPDIVINKHIDRSRIAQKVFRDAELLKSLERILHPAVGQELTKLYHEINQQQNATLFIAEIPLLFEANGKNFFNYDYSIAIIADPKLCKMRYLETEGNRLEEYTARSTQQLSQQEKADQADFVIVNNGTLDELFQQITKLYNLFVTNSQSRSQFFNESR